MVSWKNRVLLASLLIVVIALTGCIGDGLFAGKGFKLTTEVAPKGTGVIERTPDKKRYDKDAVVELKAVPNAGYKFVEWSGELESTDPTESVVVSKDLTIVANFTELDNIILNGKSNPKGAGEIVITPEKEFYTYKDEVEISAVAGSSWGFSHWVGLEATDSTTTLTVTEDLEFEAVFDLVRIAYVEGWVTDAQGGPAVEGARVQFEEQTETVTDANGYFKLEIPADQLGDIIVWRADGGATRVQGIEVAEGEVKKYNQIPTRRSFHPDWSSTPPVAKTNINPGDLISGVIDVEVELEGESPVDIVYVHLNGEQRSPIAGRAEDKAVRIDTSSFPNGEGTLRILGYDENEFVVLYIISVNIWNPVGGYDEVPGDIDAFATTAYTLAEPIGFYSANDIKLRNRQDSIFTNLEPQAAPANSTMWVEVLWLEADHADGYYVYRSFDGGQNYELFSTVPDKGEIVFTLTDYSPQLIAGKRVIYRVVPYNQSGEGRPVERDVTPLPAMDIFLVSPANGATDVELDPTFVWEHKSKDLFPKNTEFDYTWWLLDAANAWAWRDYIYDGTEYKLDEDLDPGKVYTWDIEASEAYVEYSYDSFGWSEAISMGGHPQLPNQGAKNGEFIFTTTLEPVQDGGAK